MSDFEELTDLQETVALISKTAQIQERGVAKSLTVRMPLTVFNELKAMADYSGQSINRISVQLLRVGIEAVRDALPPEDARSVYDQFSSLCMDSAKSAADGKPFEQLGDAD